jgi:hypothetical protein
VDLNNHDRAFDPEFAASPFAGNILPRRELKVSFGSAIAYTGWIDDWNFSYTPDGNSLAVAMGLDAFTILAKQFLTAGTPVAERTGIRIAKALSDPSVGWPTELRTLEAGTVDVGTQEIAAGTNVLTYLQDVTATEGGLLFVGKDGHMTFRNRRQAPASATLVKFNQDGDIPYTSIGIIFGTELLFNEVTIANVGGGTAVASDLASQGEYGKRELAQTTLLGATDLQSVELAVYYADLFSEPEYRVEVLEVCLDDIDEAQQEQVLGLEIGSVCEVSFTPNNIGDPIVKFIQVIRIEHAKTLSFHKVTLGFQEIKYLSLVLDDAVFGKLDEATLG